MLKAKQAKAKKPIDWNAINEKRKAAAKRQSERLKVKIASPEFKEKQQAKQKEQAKRTLEKAIAKAALLRQNPPAKKAVVKSDTKKPKANRGMKGRTPTAQEKLLMDEIGALNCICCELQGRINGEISLHHVDGRIKPFAHAKVLPLCKWHHDVPMNDAEQKAFADVVPVHAKGSFGGKAQFEALYGTQEELLKMVYTKINRSEPWLFSLLPNE